MWDARRDGSRRSLGWEVSITVTVHDAAEQRSAAVSVVGTFGGAASGSVSGVTTSDGTVTFLSGALAGGDTVTFSVETLDGAAVDPSVNHDPEADSDGTTIEVVKSG